MIRVLLADDHTIVRDGLQYLLQAQADMVVVGYAGGGREAIDQVDRLRPDVVLMDISMPRLNGIDATRLIKQVYPHVRVVILSMLGTPEHVLRALQAGADGYLLKESAGAEVVQAIRTVVKGGRYLSQPVTELMMDDYIYQREAVPQKDLLASLSPRELEILKLVVEGKSSNEIGALLFLSPKTVETYRSRLMGKLGIKDLPGLVKFAIQHGLTGLE